MESGEGIENLNRRDHRGHRGDLAVTIKNSVLPAYSVVK
ncbi:hypothetical protein C5S32_00370 [ANME-1 cluster archaeon GoMg1]|nr:hypothetical protein [ANME-1 cluster archaeon GoMg1]